MSTYQEQDNNQFLVLFPELTDAIKFGYTARDGNFVNFKFPQLKANKKTIPLGKTYKITLLTEPKESQPTGWKFPKYDCFAKFTEYNLAFNFEMNKQVYTKLTGAMAGKFTEIELVKNQKEKDGDMISFVDINITNNPNGTQNGQTGLNQVMNQTAVVQPQPVNQTIQTTQPVQSVQPVQQPVQAHETVVQISEEEQLWFDQFQQRNPNGYNRNQFNESYLATGFGDMARADQIWNKLISLR